MAGSVQKKRGRDGPSHAGPDAAGHQVRGPSPNPETNLVVADVMLRSVSRLVRRRIERRLLRGFGAGKAKKIVESRTLGQTLFSIAMARVFSRSVPGALLVGGGMLAKTLLDRSKNRQAARLEGEEALTQPIEES